MKNQRIMLGLGLFLVLALTWAGFAGKGHLEVIQNFVAGIPLWVSVPLFIAAYVASSFVIFDIKDIFKIVSALVFGAWGSTLCIFIAELFSNVLLFHLARRFGRVWLEKRFHWQGKDFAWVTGLCGSSQIFVLRILPVIPFRILDLAYGFTTVSFRRYFLLSGLASPARIFWLQFILAGLGLAAFDPRQLTPFLQAHPWFLQISLAYILVSALAAFVLTRRKKDVVTSKE